MKIKWNGHASFTITASDGTVIITDPYEPGAFGGGIAYGKILDQPDLVTVSHDHADHNYTAGFSGSFEVVRGPGTYRGIEFTAVPTFHDQSGGSERGTNTIFVFEVDGIRICHLGDLGHPLSAEQVGKIGNVDVLLVPIGGFYTIDSGQATDVANALSPSMIIPMHFKTDGCGFPIAKVEAFVKDKPSVRQANTAEIDIDRESLPGTAEVVVLDHAY